MESLRVLAALEGITDFAYGEDGDKEQGKPLTHCIGAVDCESAALFTVLSAL